MLPPKYVPVFISHAKRDLKFLRPLSHVGSFQKGLVERKIARPESVRTQQLLELPNIGVYVRMFIGGKGNAARASLFWIFGRYVGQI